MAATGGEIMGAFIVLVVVSIVNALCFVFAGTIFAILSGILGATPLHTMLADTFPNWIVYGVWGLQILIELAAIGSFVIIATRRSQYPEDY